MRKRRLAFVLAAAVIMALTACGSGKEDSAEAENAPTEEAAPAEEAAEPAEEGPAEEEAKPEEGGMTLGEWMQSDEAKLTEDMTNEVLKSQGITVKLLADGDVFVYEYTMPDEYAGLSEDDLAATFDPFIEESKEKSADMFRMFDSEYGISLSGAHFSFVTSDGTELYSGDVAR